MEHMEHQQGPAWPEGSAAEDQQDRSAVAAEDADGDTGPQSAASQPPVRATGEPRVDAALRLLDRLPGLPVSDHPELFEQVHAQLSEVLGELDSGSASGGPAGR
jgi:hypothetical protein